MPPCQTDQLCRRTQWLAGIAISLGLWHSQAMSAPTATHTDIVIDDVDVYPESMSTAADGTVFIGSMKGIVFRAPAGSGKAEPWILPTPENGILSLLGVLVDEPHHTLWLCSAPTSLRNPPATGTSALLAFDLKTRARKGIFPFPAPASACNDITIAKDGTALATDTPNGRIFALKPGAKTLELFCADPRLKGIDGIVFSANGTLYVNIVSRNQLLRIDRNPDGTAGAITELMTSQPIAGPDGFRLLEGQRFLLAEGNGGRVDEVSISGDTATITVLKEGLLSPPGVASVGNTAYALEGKIGYLIDPHLKGQAPGPFKAYAIPLR